MRGDDRSAANRLLAMSEGLRAVVRCGIPLLLVLFGAVLGGLFEHESGYRGCHAIERVPFQIVRPGSYCLEQDIVYSAGDPITIAADFVKLDLADHKISAGDPILDREVTGIRGVDHRHVSIRNGTIAGYMYGISLNTTGTADFAIENIEIESNTFRGIRLTGVGTRVVGNHVKATGGTLVYPESYAMGIEVGGASCSILDNEVIDTMPVGVGEGAGVAAVDGDHCLVSNNLIMNRAAPPRGRQFGVGIGGNDDTRDVTVRDNTIIDTTYAFGSGIGSGLLLTGNSVWAATCGTLYEAPTLAVEHDNIVRMPADQGCSDRLDYQMPLALTGDAAAAFRVGQIYYEGTTETRNLALGYAWFTIASERGNAEATRWVAIRL
jgi:hypothetical protein